MVFARIRIKVKNLIGSRYGKMGKSGSEPWRRLSSLLDFIAYHEEEKEKKKTKKISFR